MPQWGNPCCHSEALSWGGLREGAMLLPGLWNFVQDEAISQYSPWCQALQFLPECHWCHSSCCPAAKAQREWVCISPKSIVGLFGGDSWESCSFFHFPTPSSFYSQKLWGLIFLTLEPWAGWSDVGLGSLTPEVCLPIFFITCVWGTNCSTSPCLSVPLCNSPHLHPSYLSGWMWLL